MELDIIDKAGTIAIKVSQFELFIRQLSNGSIAILSLFVAIMCARYILIDPTTREWRWRTERWFGNVGVQGASAIFILTFGYVIRAGESWAAVVWLDVGWNPKVWVTTELFIFPALLIISGYSLMLLWFTPPRVRWRVLIGSILVAVAVPFVIAVAV